MSPLSKIHESWNPFLHDYIIASQKLPNTEYFPERENIFNVFSMPVQDIKVVILGQDPYHTKNQAMGYAFAVSETFVMPPSLRVIQQEVGKPIRRDLLNWREQGVFLLNTALTVEPDKAGSHLKLWEEFTRSVIQYISVNNPCIWVLWGKKAQVFKPFIVTPRVTNIELGKKVQAGDFNYLLEAPHPAAERYSGGKAGFIGCNHFSITNEILKINNKPTIMW